MTKVETLERLVHVPLGDRSYDILIGPGLMARAGGEISTRIKGRRAAIVTDENVGARYLDGLMDSLQTKALNAGLAVNGALRGGKHHVWEGGFKVPFIVRWPARVAAGSVCKEMVSLADILATTAEVVGEPLPPAAAGCRHACGQATGGPIDPAALRTAERGIDGGHAGGDGPGLGRPGEREVHGGRCGGCRRQGAGDGDPGGDQGGEAEDAPAEDGADVHGCALSPVSIPPDVVGSARSVERGGRRQPA